MKSITTSQGRFYETSDGKLVPSITTIMNAAPVAFGLRNWWISKSEQDIKRILKEAGERGTATHDAIERLIKKGAITTRGMRPGVIKMVMGFADFYNENDVEILSTEQVVSNNDPEYPCVGRYDADMNFNKTYVVADWKTSKEIHHGHRVQVAFYAKCKGAKEGLILQLKEGKKIRHKVHRVKNIDELYEDFKALYRLYHSWAFPIAPPKEEKMPETITINKGE